MLSFSISISNHRTHFVFNFLPFYKINIEICITYDDNQKSVTYSYSFIIRKRYLHCKKNDENIL